MFVTISTIFSNIFILSNVFLWIFGDEKEKTETYTTLEGINIFVSLHDNNQSPHQTRP